MLLEQINALLLTGYALGIGILVLAVGIYIVWEMRK